MGVGITYFACDKSRPAFAGLQKRARKTLFVMLCLLALIFTVFGVFPGNSQNTSSDAQDNLFGTNTAYADVTPSSRGNAYAVLSSDGTLTFVRSYYSYANGTSGTLIACDNSPYTGTIYNKNFESSNWIMASNVPWYSNRAKIKSVVFKDQIKPYSMQNWFYECTNLSSVVNVGNLDCSGNTLLDYTFYHCTSLTSIDLSVWDTSNCDDTTSMFEGCTALTSANLSGWSMADMSWIRRMFYDCTALTELNLSNGWATASVDPQYFVYNCPNLSRITIGEDFNFKGTRVSADYQINLPTPPTSSGYSGYWCMEDGTQVPLTSANLRDTYDGSTMAGTWVWQKASSKITLYANDGSGRSSETTVTAQSGSYNYYNLKATMFLRDGYRISSWNTEPDGSGKSYSAYATLYPASDMTLYAQWTKTSVTPSDVGTAYAILDSDGVMTFVRSNSSSITGANTDNPNVTVTAVDGTEYKGYVFAGFENYYPTSASNLPWSSFRDEILTVDFKDEIKPTSTAYWFSSCTNVTTIANLPNLDVSTATSMVQMFSDCPLVTSLNLSNWDTSQVSDMTNIFNGDTGLEEIQLGENFSFKGNSITNTAQQGLLPTPSSGSNNTGNWIRTDAAYSYSPTELRNNYTGSSMAGTWV